jgi:hypothetical protein
LKALQGGLNAWSPDPIDASEIEAELAKAALDGTDGIPRQRFCWGDRGRGNPGRGDGKKVCRVEPEGCNRRLIELSRDLQSVTALEVL